jgi:hypothetical protein
MSKILLLAKKELRDRNPAAIPDDTPLEEWLDQYFDFLGPATEEELKEALERVEPWIDPDGSGRRYWAMFDLKEGVKLGVGLLGQPVDPPRLS